MCGCSLGQPLCQLNPILGGTTRLWSAVNGARSYYGWEAALLIVTLILACLTRISARIRSKLSLQTISPAGNAAPLPSLATKRNARALAVQRALRLPVEVEFQSIQRPSIYISQTQWSCSAVSIFIHDYICFFS